MGQSPYSIIANCEGGFSPPIIAMTHTPAGCARCGLGEGRKVVLWRQGLGRAPQPPELDQPPDLVSPRFLWLAPERTCGVLNP